MTRTTLAALIYLATVPLGVVEANQTVPPDTLTGSWRITEAVDPKGHPITPAPRSGQVIAFRSDRVAGPAPFGCGHAQYENVTVPPQGLFQGALSAADRVVMVAQFTLPAQIKTLRVTCDSGAFDYHVAGKRLLIMLDGQVQVLVHSK